MLLFVEDVSKIFALLLVMIYIVGILPTINCQTYERRSSNREVVREGANSVKHA